MFNWQELISMNIREKSYWSRQAMAIKRIAIMDMACAIGLTLSDKDDRERMIDELELIYTKSENIKRRSKMVWDMMFLTKGKKRSV